MTCLEPGVRIRVLHVHSGNLYGGIERLLVTLARARSFPVEFSFALCFSGRLSEELKALTSPVDVLGSVRTSRPWTVRRARAALGNILDQHRFDVVVCHSSWSQAVFAVEAKRRTIPQVFWLHDTLSGRGWLEAWASLHRPDAVLCNSNFAGSGVAAIYPGESPNIIRYPVSGPRRLLNASERAELRREIGAETDAIVVLQTSRMEAWKGQHLHLEAVALLRDLPKWEVWFLGGAQRPKEHAYAEGLQRQAERSGIAGRVRFLGERSDVPRLLSSADIYCQPNLQPEPFGIALIEALFHELPVVTMAMGGPMESVDKSCGILIPPGDITALSGALRELIRNPALRESLGAAGPARARQLCDEQQQLEKLRGFFARLAGRQSAAA